MQMSAEPLSNHGKFISANGVNRFGQRAIMDLPQALINLMGLR